MFTGVLSTGYLRNVLLLPEPLQAITHLYRQNSGCHFQGSVVNIQRLPPDEDNSAVHNKAIFPMLRRSWKGSFIFVRRNIWGSNASFFFIRLKLLILLLRRDLNTARCVIWGAENGQRKKMITTPDIKWSKSFIFGISFASKKVKHSLFTEVSNY